MVKGKTRALEAILKAIPHKRRMIFTIMRLLWLLVVFGGY
jgi:hypothetical protein